MNLPSIYDKLFPKQDYAEKAQMIILRSAETNHNSHVLNNITIPSSCTKFQPITELFRSGVIVLVINQIEKSHTDYLIGNSLRKGINRL